MSKKFQDLIDRPQKDKKRLYKGALSKKNLPFYKYRSDQKR